MSFVENSQTLTDHDFGKWADAVAGVAGRRCDVLKHIEALNRALEEGNPEVFVEYIRWAGVVLEGIGLEPEALLESLGALAQVLGADLSGDLALRVDSMLQAGIARLRSRPLVEVEAGQPPFDAKLPAMPAFATPAAALQALREPLVRASLARHFMRRPEDAMDSPKGSPHRERCLRDIGEHLSYLEDSIRAENPGLFEDYINWVRAVLQESGASETELKSCLLSLADVLESLLSEADFSVVRESLRGGLAVLEVEIDAAPCFLDRNSPYGKLATDYLSALRAGDRQEATKLVLAAAESGVPVEELYLEVLQSCQYEVGRLWQRGEISIAEEHFCTAVTHMAMSQLYPHLESSESRGDVVVATVMGDHELGLRMVCDLLEADGWTSYYVGVNVPLETVIQAVVERGAKLLAISVTMGFNLQELMDLVRRLRSDPRCAGVRTVVGGYPFKADADLWRSVGADASACDARTAVRVVRSLVS